MAAECCGARPRTRLLSIGVASLPAALAAALLPKCPLCLAAPLALLGVTVVLPASAYVAAVIGCAALGAGALILARRRLF